MGSDTEIESNDSDSDHCVNLDKVTDSDTPPKKKLKVKRTCSFQNNYLNDPLFKDWLMKIREDTTKAKCRYCNCTFSIKSEGRSSLTKHMATQKHKTNKDTIDKNKTLEIFSAKSSKTANESIIKEICLIYHGVIHHHSYRSQECGIKLWNHLSSCDKNDAMRCGRTKSSSIVENVLSPFSVECILKDIRDGPFSTSIDASNRGTNIFIHLSYIFKTV